ncbi:kinase-like protein [Imleria badia]|nr:kinase-like protein [Imleria badia]
MSHTQQNDTAEANAPHVAQRALASESTPAKKKYGPDLLYASVVQPFDEVRHPLGKEMDGRCVGPMPVDAFFDKCVPATEEPLPDVSDNPFVKVPRDGAESSRYDPSIAAIQGCMPPLQAVNTTTKGDTVNNVKLKTDISIYNRVDGVAPTDRTMELWMESKANKDGAAFQDPRDDTEELRLSAIKNGSFTPATVPPIQNGINDTLFNRLVVMAAVKTFGGLLRRQGHVLFLTKALCIKYGHSVQISEAFTMRFIASHTSIPVPKVYCAFVHKGCTYIMMERIGGTMLADALHSLPGDSKERIFGQLRSMVNEMRELPAPRPGVSNVVGGPVYDRRFPGPLLRIGPFSSIHEFHLFLRHGLEPTEGCYAEIGDMMRLQDQPWPMPVFTHGDLSRFNILVRGDRVVGIIEWETAGWFPTYWEYSMAYQAWWPAHPYNEFWRDVMERFLSRPMEKELAMECTRVRYFGDF